MNRLAPSGGYKFNEKAQYRRHVWGEFRQLVMGPETAHVMLMPSAEGDEIRAAEARGFRQENMHIVDRNPAIVATLKRRFPKLGYRYGVSTGEAAKRIRRNMAAINLDYCGCVSPPTLSEFATVLRYLPFLRCQVAVTVQRGRERGVVAELIRNAVDGEGGLNQVCKSRDGLSAGDAVRVGTLMARVPMAGCAGVVRRVGQYKSKNVTMLWMIATVFKVPFVIEAIRRTAEFMGTAEQNEWNTALRDEVVGAAVDARQCVSTQLNKAEAYRRTFDDLGNALIDVGLTDLVTADPIDAVDMVFGADYTWRTMKAV